MIARAAIEDDNSIEMRNLAFAHPEVVGEMALLVGAQAGQTRATLWGSGADVGSGWWRGPGRSGRTGRRGAWRHQWLY